MYFGFVYFAVVHKVSFSRTSISLFLKEEKTDIGLLFLITIENKDFDIFFLKCQNFY